MGRMITIPVRAITLTTSDADFDILQVVASSTFRGAVHMLFLSTDAVSNSRADIAIVRRSTSGTGTAITEIADDQGNSRTPSFTAVHSVAAPGTLTVTGPSFQWNLLNDLLYIPPPECREIMVESGILCVHCATSLTGTIKCNGFMKIEEY